MKFYQSEEQHSNFVSCFSPNLRLQFSAYAKGYRLAAGSLAQQLIAKNRFPDYEGYPLVFLYRHAFELALKNVIYRTALLAAFRRLEDIDGKLLNDHNLERLSRVATKSLLAVFSDDDDLHQVCDRVSTTAREFTSIDADSFAYRYPITRKGEASTKEGQIVNAQAMASHMDQLLIDLEIIDFGIECETEAAQDIWELIESVWPSDESL